MKILFGICIVLSSLLLTPASYAEENFAVIIGKARILPLSDEIGQIVIGNPEISDVSVDSKRTLIIFGKKIGETSLAVFNKNGEILLERDIKVTSPNGVAINVVSPSSDKGKSNEINDLCNPRCNLDKTLAP